MKYIQSTNLIQWADTKSAEGLFPLLLRKLIICSCGTFPNIHLPAGDGVYKPGVDGVCTTEKGGWYVPDGTSIWEFGRSENFKVKFEKDFKKRDEELDPAEKAKSTFIFVTPRRWTKAPKKEALAKKKQKASGWGTVRILDSDDLETWLELCPIRASPSKVASRPSSGPAPKLMLPLPSIIFVSDYKNNSNSWGLVVENHGSWIQIKFINGGLKI